MIRVDLHSHSSYSADGWSSPLEVVERALAAGLDRIAITDHGEIDGALEARDRFPDQVIVGEEVYCDDGSHLIGLFLEEWIPGGLSIREAAQNIRHQGGVVYAPHPYAYLRNADRHAEPLISVADVVEVFNSRAFLQRWNCAADDAARDRGLPRAAGSDAHFPWELGRAYTEMPAFGSAKEFREALRSAKPVGIRLGSPFLHVVTKALEVSSPVRRRDGRGTRRSDGRRNDGGAST
jgi:predicted metal-dependent phosphoesterase TrpH